MTNQFSNNGLAVVFRVSEASLMMSSAEESFRGVSKISILSSSRSVSNPCVESHFG